MIFYNRIVINTVISPLFADFYSLTMIQGYFLTRRNYKVVFDMFFRTQPYNSGYAIFAGLQPFLEQLASIQFLDEDIEFLRAEGLFKPEFLEYLATFKFSGDIWAMKEGSVCFPSEPLLRVHAPIIEAQLIEGLLLNYINFSSLIATKCARMQCSARGKDIIELGLRRAQGPNGAVLASRAAFIGGACATSNVAAGKQYGIPVVGTMSHSWIMSFPDEVTAFKEYASIYPDNTVLLLDTYDTLKSGLPSAIQIGKKLYAQGKKFGVRLDSGDLEYLSKRVRTALDEAGMYNTFIVASNELNEEIIAELTASQCPIDIWGVGTNIVTGAGASAFSGVYKLCAQQQEQDGTMISTLKISNDIEKSSLPTIKQVYRYYRKSMCIADLIATEQEAIPLDDSILFHHPYVDHKQFLFVKTQHITTKPLLQLVMKQGNTCTLMPSLKDIQAYTSQELACLDHTYKRLLNPHIYKVSISSRLKQIRNDLINHRNNNIVN